MGAFLNFVVVTKISELYSGIHVMLTPFYLVFFTYKPLPTYTYIIIMI